jgi:hypothetical protein
MRLIYAIGFFVLLLFAGCRREFESPSWEMNLNAPLIYSDLGIEDLIADSILSVNPDNSVNLVFDETFFSYGLDSVLGLADSTVKDSFYAIISSYVSPGGTIFSNVDNNDLNINGAELTQIDLKQGFLDYKITSNIQDTTIVTYTITTGTFGALPIELVVTIPPATVTTNSVVSGTFSLAGASLDLTGILNNTFNSYQTSFVAKTAPGATGVSLTSFVSKVSLEANFRDMVPSYVRGYFGNLTNNTPLESQTFNFLESLNSATLDLSAINTKFYVSNGLGADASFRLDSLIAYKTSTATSVVLNHSMIGQTTNINRALDMGWYASPYKYEVDVNSSNSNIESFAELLPDVVKYKLGVELNPLGNISGHSDFVYENSRVEAGLSVNIPLNLIASQIKLADTLDFNLDDYDQNGKILKGRLKVNVMNGLPLKATLKVQMLDENSMVIGNLISSAVVNGNPSSTSSSTGSNNYQTIYVDMNSDLLITAYRAKKLVIYTEFETTPSGTFVSVYNTQRFKTQISILADYLTHE